ncbi:MAG: hypothetical protein ACOC6Q_02295 [Patescibacteria group bacterium]
MDFSNLVLKEFVADLSSTQKRQVDVFSVEDVILVLGFSPTTDLDTGLLDEFWKRFLDQFRSAQGSRRQVLAKSIQSVKDIAEEYSLKAEDWFAGVVSSEEEAFYLYACGGCLAGLVRDGDFYYLGGVHNEETVIKSIVSQPGDRLIILSPSLKGAIPPKNFLDTEIPWEDVAWRSRSQVRGAAGVVLDLAQQGSVSREGKFAVRGWLSPVFGLLKKRKKKQFFVSRSEPTFDPRSSRKIAWPLIFISIVFLGGVVYTLVNTRQRVRSDNALQLLNTATENVDSAKKLIGLDDHAVNQHLTVAQEKLEEVRILGVKNGRVASLEEEIAVLEKELLKVTSADVNVFYNLSRLQYSGQGSLVYGQDSVYLLDTVSGNLFQFTNYDDGPKAVSLREGLDGAESLSCFENGLFAWGNEQVYVFDFSNNLSRFTVDPTWGIVDGEGFGEYVYFLSPAERQIFKGSAFQSGKGFFRAWLRDEVPITESSRFAIDGSVYLWTDSATDSGLLRKFMRGKEQDFSLEDILKDPLVSPAEIVTNAELENLYFLDDKVGRILVYSKEGSLLHQFKDSRWRKAQSLALSRDENVAYVLTEQKIFEFPLP